MEAQAFAKLAVVVLSLFLKANLSAMIAWQPVVLEALNMVQHETID